MARLMRCAIACLLPLLACGSTTGSVPPWDLFVFAQQWPGSYRNTWDSCVQSWTIHGLWPSYNTSSGTPSCTGDPFSEGKLSPVMDRMNCQWPSNRKPNSGFWKHEWSTHGVCAVSDPLTSTQLSFFTAALNLNQKINVTVALQKASIFPKGRGGYTVGTIRSAVEKELGVSNVALHCQDSHFLAGIRVCVTKDLELEDCPPDVWGQHHSCGEDTKTLYYDPIKH